MTQTFLLIGTDANWLQQTTLDRCKEIIQGQKGWETIQQNPDFHLFGDQKAVSIEECREIIKLAAKKPFQEQYTTICLLQVDQMGIPAQNALLKLLEEPPSYVILFLWTNKKDPIRSTILSRCIMVEQDNTNVDVLTDEAIQSIGRLLTATIGDRLLLVQKIVTDKQSVSLFLDQLTHYFRQLLLEKHQSASAPKDQLLTTIRQLLDLKTNLDQQVSPKIIGDMIAFKLPQISQI